MIRKSTDHRSPQIVISSQKQVQTRLIFGSSLRCFKVSCRSCRTYLAWSCYWEEWTEGIRRLKVNIRQSCCEIKGLKVYKFPMVILQFPMHFNRLYCDLPWLLCFFLNAITYLPLFCCFFTMFPLYYKIPHNFLKGNYTV